MLTSRSTILLSATGFGAGLFVGPNDLVVDSTGGVYFSDPNFGSGQNGYTQSVYYVNAAGVVSQIASNLSRPNGVLLSADERSLHVVLSGAARLMTCPVLSPGVVGPATTNAIPQTGDGMTLDTQGNLYLCQPGVNQILVRSPSGVALGSITFPEAPANCTFGGKDMKTLTHPLCPGDEWRIGLERIGDLARVSFRQVAGRGFEVEYRPSVGAGASWQALNVTGNPPAVPSSNRLAVIDDAIGLTNRYYRVRVFEPQ